MPKNVEKMSTIYSPNFEARKGDSNQSINHDTSTKVTFNNETFDTASAYASDKFTVPSGQGGKYFIYASVAWNNDDNGRRAVFLYKNGTFGAPLMGK